MKLLLNSLLASALLFSGCRTFQGGPDQPPTVTPTPLTDHLNNLPELDGEPIYLGVYNFKDLTGQWVV